MRFYTTTKWIMRITCILLLISAIIPLPFSFFSFHPPGNGFHYIRFAFGFTLSSASILIFSIPALFIGSIGLFSSFYKNQFPVLLVKKIFFFLNLKYIVCLILLITCRFFWGSLDAAYLYGSLAGNSSSETRWAFLIQFLLV